MAKDQQGSGGGTATHAGTNYQNRVAAWFAVHILAEQDAVPPLDLPASVTMESLQAETAHAVDDLAVATSAGASVLSQAKHSLSLQTAADSQLGTAISQFVREYRAAQPPLDPAKDRLVITTSSLSSAPIKTHLPAFLTRVRSSSSPDQEWTSGNKDENDAASVLREHIIRAWRDEAGSDPSTADILNIVRLARIQILDVDQDGHSEREAKQLLRASILADPAMADAAWNTLITATAGYAVNAQRADRAALQRTLTDAGIAIKAPRSFQADIKRLQDHTAATLHGLIDFSRIRVKGHEITIRRAAADDLRQAASEGHFLVLGVPGAGKSGALYEFAQDLVQQGADVVLFAVDQIEAASTGALRIELNLAHELLTVLAAWPGTAPGYLVIDALDAARSEGAIKTLQTIIGKAIGADSRWHVIASVRKFDLRYNSNLQRLFRGTPASAQYKDAEFAAVRHVNIPALSDDELVQLQSQSPALGALVSQAQAALQELLHLPFNLRLLSELLDAGITAEELQPVRTQVELLDRYWQERIIRHDAQGDARELVLRRVTAEMVARRSLRTARTAAIANDAASGTFLDDLLSTHVLAEWATQAGAAQREFLTFPHHLLYDYAVARLYVPPEGAGLIELLAKQADLLIAIRPSIEIHLQRLWHRDLAAFWDLTFRALTSPLNEVGKLLGPSVVALHATTLAQTQPLANCLDDPSRSATGIAALQHILATLLTHGTATGRPRPGPWAEFLDLTTANVTVPLSHAVRPYVIFLSENTARLSERDKNCVGAVARRLLAFSLQTTPFNWLLAVNCIAAVTKTVESDPTASVSVLRQCLSADYLREHGYRIFPALSRNAVSLMTVNPQFVRDLYVAGFENADKSDAKTTMGDSQILPMFSNRKQDYESGLWKLGEYFPHFLTAAPRQALDALLNITGHYVKAKKKFADGTMPVSLDGCQSSLIRDGSAIWANGVSQNDNPLKMLQAFERYLEAQTDAGLIQQLVQDVAAHQPPAAIWRVLLSTGTKHPTTIGRSIRSLAWDDSILTESDTTRLAGAFIKAIYPLLDQTEKAQVEQAIMGIPTKAIAERVEAANRTRDRLLGCIHRTLFITPEATARRDALDSSGGPPENRPDRGIVVTDGGGEFDPEEYLRDKGVPLEDPEHQRLRNLMRPLGAFNSEFLNGAPPPDRIAAILPIVRALNAEAVALQQVHQELRNQGFVDLVQTAAVILRSNEYKWDQETLALIRSIVLGAVGDSQPEPDTQQGNDTEEAISFNAPRIEGAQALMRLARRDPDMATELRPVIVQLAADPVASVRFQIAYRLLDLYHTERDLMWQFLEQFSQKEEHREVLQATLGVLQRAASVDPPKVAGLTLNIFDRMPFDGNRVTEARDQCSNIFISLMVWYKESLSGAVIERMIAAPSQHARDLRHVVFDLSGFLKDEKEETRKTSAALLERILDASVVAAQEMEARFSGKPLGTWPEAEQEQYGELFRIADEIALRVYLISGASSADKDSPLPVEPEFYHLVQPLLKKLASMWHPHTAHQVIETLAYFVPVDPAEVLLLIGQVVRASSAHGYQYEQLGEQVIVRIVERYLAEYRPLLRDNPECHAVLMEILDVFVRVGWPSAHQLTYRLSDIYR
ncbi:MAG: hypothetical protein JWO19_2273 [Bryobacterales bacterium]|nr:hypothetical protein [Bryobacterales bacterium]